MARHYGPRKRESRGSSVGLSSWCLVFVSLVTLVSSFHEPRAARTTAPSRKPLREAPPDIQAPRPSVDAGARDLSPPIQTSSLGPKSAKHPPAVSLVNLHSNVLLPEMHALSSTAGNTVASSNVSSKTHYRKAFVKARSSDVKLTIPGSRTRIVRSPRAASQPADSNTVCGPGVYFINSTKGHLKLPPVTFACVEWRISTPRRHGIVLEFNEVDMDYFHSITVSGTTTSETENQTDFSESSSKRTYRTITKGRGDLSNLLIYQNQMHIVVVLGEQKKKRNSPVDYKTKLKLSFRAYPVDLLPLPMEGESGHSKGSYNCWREDVQVQIPDVFMCDGVEQCDGAEDEAECSYRNQGCGDWTPYRDKCLQATFVVNRLEVYKGYAYESMHSVAEKACASKHNAQLAVLPDDEGLKTVSDIIRLSGFQSAAIGLKKFQPKSKRLAHLYRYTWQWGGVGGPVDYYQQWIQRDGVMKGCAVLRILPYIHTHPVDCESYTITGHDGYVCMRQNTFISESTPRVSSAKFSTVKALTSNVRTKECPDGSAVQQFHPCKWDTKEFGLYVSPQFFPLFPCRFGPHVHYSVVCDGMRDCADGSDESDCTAPKFMPLKKTSFLCHDFQLVTLSQRCDGKPDCFDKSDEDFCTSCSRSIYCPGVGCISKYYTMLFPSCPLLNYYPGYVIFPKPAAVEFSSGWTKLKLASDDGKLFKCHSGLNIPSFLINNGEKDCIYGEDEGIPWENVTCPGFYRCHQFGQCVHPDYVCDGVYHCPNKDDERYCRLPCPQNCTCEGFVYACKATFSPEQHVQVRYLDLSGSTESLVDFLRNIHVMELLTVLILAKCELTNVTLRDMAQLKTLDLKYNRLVDLSKLDIKGLTGVTHLDLSYNPLVPDLDSAFATGLNMAGLNRVQTLYLASTGITSISGEALKPLSQLTILDITRNRLERYDSEVFRGLEKLQGLVTDDRKLCCPYFHRHPIQWCDAPVNELSSCNDLLQSNFFRVFLWLLSVFAIAGNAGVLLYRTVTDERASPSGFRMLVKNLCASDFLMGVYLLMIGVADSRSRGRNVEKESEWRHSAVCAAAGFLAFVSSEVSALIISFITLDRLLLICFPFKKSIHLTTKSTAAVCCCVWCTGLILGAVPLIAGLEFYEQTGICLPLPITRQQYSGQGFSFAVFIVVNFVLFVLIGTGQIFIYRAVRKTSMKAQTKRGKQNATIARRLFLVVFTDFCCWFPIGVMGLMTAGGVPVPGVVNVWVAIFVLPLNSALNPFLYTLSGLLVKWDNRRVENRTKRIFKRLQSEVLMWPPENVEEMIRTCLRSNLVKHEEVLSMLSLSESSGKDLEHGLPLPSETTCKMSVGDTTVTHTET